MKNRAFWIAEGILIALAVFFMVALIGYGALSLVLAAAAVVIAAFKLLRILAAKHPKTALALRVALIVLLAAAVGLTAYAEYYIIGASAGDAQEDAHYVIVLGAGVNGTEPSLSLVDRLKPALLYMEAHPETKAVLSGGQGAGEDISEAQCMFDWLTRRGIAPDRLILEERAVSTQENIEFSLELIKAQGGSPGDKVGIVSSEYHIYRAQYIAEELGAEPVGIPGRTSLPILRFNYFLREAAAVWALWLT